jgi:hypothetical protein
MSWINGIFGEEFDVCRSWRAEGRWQSRLRSSVKACCSCELGCACEEFERLVFSAVCGDSPSPRFVHCDGCYCCFAVGSFS